jgi:hypothetical protein
MADYRSYDITVTSVDRKTEFASALVTLSAEQPLHDVTLRIH